LKLPFKIKKKERDFKGKREEGEHHLIFLKILSSLGIFSLSFLLGFPIEVMLERMNPWAFLFRNPPEQLPAMTMRKRNVQLEGKIKQIILKITGHNLN
jgi:hypothetical protein